MRDQVRALIGLISCPSLGAFGTALLATDTAAAADSAPRISTAHPPPSSRTPQPAAPAPHAPAGSSCFDAHELGQELRQTGKLLESRAAFTRCASEHCPDAVQRDCQQWSSEIEAELPSVMFRVDVAGHRRSDARVVIDGQWRRQALAQPVRLDPGLHELHVSAPAAVPVQRQLELRPGAREQLSLSLSPLAEEPKRVPALSWVLGGVGLAGTAGFVAFGLSSRSLEHDLEHRCSPLCSEEQIDRVRQRSVIANVSLGLGVGSLAAAGALYLLRTSDAPGEPELRVGLAPVRRGAVCNVQLRTF